MSFTVCPKSSYALSLVLLCVFLFTHCVSAEMFWLSGPAFQWVVASNSPLSEQLLATLQADFAAALGDDGTVNVHDLSPRTAATLGDSPAVGATVVCDVTGSSLLSSEITRLIYTASLTKTNTIMNSLMGVDVVVIHGLPEDTVLQMDSKVGITGASVMWEATLNVSGPVGSGALLSALQVDFQAGVDASQENMIVEAHTIAVDEFSAYVYYAIWRLSDGLTLAKTDEEVAQLMLNSTLTCTNKWLEEIIARTPALAKLKDLFAIFMPIAPHVPLQADPNPPSLDEPLPIVDTDVTHYILYFGNTAEGWQNAVADEASINEAKNLLRFQTTIAVDRGGFRNSVEVTDFVLVNDDKAKVNGMYAFCTVTQSLTEISVEKWSSDEVASMLAYGDYATILALYTGSDGGRLAGVEVNTSYGYTCSGGACIEVIAMSATVVFLMLLTIIITCAVQCCCMKGKDAAGEPMSGKAENPLRDPVV